jgi:hypothetical protein
MRLILKRISLFGYTLIVALPEPPPCGCSGQNGTKIVASRFIRGRRCNPSNFLFGGSSMPALFAYLVALCLLLSGGYGALNWLSQPEQVKVAAKAHPKPKLSLSYEAEPPTSSSAQDDDSNDPRSSNRASLSGVGAHAGAQPVNEIAGPPSVQQSRSANATVPSDDSKPSEKDVKQSARVGSTSNLRAVAISVPSTVAKPWKRNVIRQASNRSEKRALTLMTLRTIVFPDGRRTTQLLPYRGSERALAFQLGD